jgi:hypothetical protein
LVGRRLSVWWPDDKAHYQGTVTDYYYCSSSSSDGAAGSPEAPTAAATAPGAAVCITGSKRKGASTGTAATMQVRVQASKACSVQRHQHDWLITDASLFSYTLYSTASVHLATSTMAVLAAAPMLLLSCKSFWDCKHLARMPMLHHAQLIAATRCDAPSLCAPLRSTYLLRLPRALSPAAAVATGQAQGAVR